ncbi:MAG: DUF3990 domain-containing protein [Treponema sp.]|nr:DUF3990 domain-containing protein [Treponema sp.]
MKVYHGSLVVVKKPNVLIGRNNLDFGKGFYTTDLQQQAEDWVQRFLKIGKRCYINTYEFDSADIAEKYRFKRFPAYDEAWLDFIISCRKGNDDFLKYDIIEGGIANDKVFNTIELYFDNLIDKRETLKRLSFEKPNNQICFISQDVADNLLHFECAKEVC